MTVSTSSYAPTSYAGNGVTTAFPTLWPFYELKVTHTSAAGVATLWTAGTQYTISGGAGLTGTVTSTAGNTPATGTTLRIERVTVKSQSVDMVDSGSFPATSNEGALDRLTMIAQEDAYRIGVVEGFLSSPSFGGLSPSTFGAVGNGVANDTVALQTMLTLGLLIAPDHGKTYLITTRLNITVAGSGFSGDGTATLLMGSNAGQFDNTVLANAFNANAVGVAADGIARPIFKGVRITYQSQAGRDDRIVKALHFKTCTDIVVDHNEAWDFTKAYDIFSFNGCTRGSVSSNHIHDCTTNSATTGQITGIGFDGDTTTGSSAIDVNDNRIRNLTVGAAFLAAFGYQTDGITLGGTTTKTTHHLRVIGNWINDVGEGIDVFGDDNIVIGNHLDKCYNFGVKLIHGASRNIVFGNDVTEAGLNGISLQGSNTVAEDTADNYVFGNTIYKLDPNGAWASSIGIEIAANGGTTYLPRRNKIWNNTIDGNGTGEYGIVAQAGAGTLNSVRRNAISNVTTADTLLDATVVPDQELDKPAANTVWGNLTGAAALAKFETMAALRTALGITAAGLALIDDADITAQRTTLGLGTAAIKNTGTSGDALGLLNANNQYDGFIFAKKPLAFARSTMTLANGLNSNITNPDTSYVRIEGPTAGFSVGGIVKPASPIDDGALMVLRNTTAQIMTIVNQDASSSALNQIDTLTGGNIVLGAGESAATLLYDGSVGRWFVVSTNG